MSPSTSGRYPTTQMTTEQNDIEQYTGGHQAFSVAAQSDSTLRAHELSSSPSNRVYEQ